MIPTSAWTQQQKLKGEGGAKSSGTKELAACSQGPGLALQHYKESKMRKSRNSQKSCKNGVLKRRVVKVKSYHSYR